MVARRTEGHGATAQVTHLGAVGAASEVGVVVVGRSGEAGPGFAADALGAGITAGTAARAGSSGVALEEEALGAAGLGAVGPGSPKRMALMRPSAYCKRSRVCP